MLTALIAVVWFVSTLDFSETDRIVRNFMKSVRFGLDYIMVQIGNAIHYIREMGIWKHNL